MRQTMLLTGEINLKTVTDPTVPFGRVTKELDFLPIVNPNMKIFHLSMSTFCPPCIRLES